MRRWGGPVLTVLGTLVAVAAIFWWGDPFAAIGGGILFTVGSYMWMVIGR